MVEVGVVCFMVVGVFVVCMGVSLEVIEQVVEIGIEYNLGLICDLIGGFVQVLCIECNVFGVIKVILSVNFVLSGEVGIQKVSLDNVICVMCLIVQGMRNEFKEMFLSGLVMSVFFNIFVSVLDC